MAASRQPVIDFVSLPLNFFARPAQIVGPDLVGCRLVKRQADGGLLWGVIVETEAYSQDDPACHGYRRRSPQNETLFRKRLPHKVKALSKWKSIDIQRINPEEPDYRRISSYLGKQTDLELIALDPFNSDLSPKKK